MIYDSCNYAPGSRVIHRVPQLSLPGAGFRDPGPGYFLSQKVASYHIHECCNSEVA